MKNVQKLLFLFILVLSAHFSSTAQTAAPPLSPLDSMFNSLDAIYLNQPDSSEASARNNYSRWKAFWQTRMSSNPTEPNNFTGGYFTAMNAYLAECAQNPCLAANTNNMFNGEWQLKGPTNLSTQAQGVVWSVWADPVTPESCILAGSNFGGLWKKEFNGPWVNLTDNDPGLPGTAGLGAIEVRPNSNNQEIYISMRGGIDVNITWQATPWGYGLYYTNDGGATWQQDVTLLTTIIPLMGGGVQAMPYVTELKMQPGTNWLFAGADQYLLKKDISNMGNPWIDVTPPLKFCTPIVPGDPINYVIHDLEFNPADPDDLFVSALGIVNCDPTIWRCDVASTAWSNITPATIAAYVLSASSDGNMYAHGGPLFKYDMSTASSSWVTCATPMGAQNGYSRFTISPNNPNVAYGGGVFSLNQYTTTDGWQTMTRTNLANMFHPTDPIHADFRGIHLAKSTNTVRGTDDILIVGNDGGVCIKRAGRDPAIFGINTLERVPDEDLVISQWYGFDVSEQDALIAGGVMHNGMYTYDKDRGGAKWTEPTLGQGFVTLGDGYNAEFDKNNRRLAYGAINEPGLNFYNFGADNTQTNSSIHWQSLNNPTQGRYLNVRPMEVQEENNQLRVGHTQPMENVGLPGANVFSFPSPIGFFIPYVNFNILNFNNKSDGCALRAFKTTPSGDYSYYAIDRNPRDRIYKKTPANWFDITPNAVRDIDYGHIITDIELHPQDPDIIYLSMGDIDGGPNGNSSAKRVMRYDANANPDWTDISTGLPAVPVNCITYQNGSNEILYAGTDVGVFVFNPSLQEWEPYNHRLVPLPNGNQCMPSMIVTDLEINYCEGKLYAATHGRGIWESGLVPGNSQFTPFTTRDITQDVIWSSSKYLEGNVIVRAGHTLTITGTDIGASPDDYEYSTIIHMPKGGRIEVEKNAKLIINNATITQSCDHKWDGIFLHGDGTSVQFEDLSNNRYPNQGFLEIVNGRIEHAWAAIHNFGGSDPWPNTGGVVRANHCFFNNNWKAAEFMAYEVQLPNVVEGSNFALCKFDIDEDLFGIT